MAEGQCPLQVPTGASPLDLELHVRELPDGRLETTLVYATDLFDPSTAQRMSNHFMVWHWAVLHTASPLCLHVTPISNPHRPVPGCESASQALWLKAD